MSHAVSPPSPPSLYDQDLFAWTRDQARLLRERRFSELDLAQFIDEVESVGGSQRDAIESRLVVLCAHLLKWKYQPGTRSSGWQGTIFEQRRSVARLVRASPSLRAHPGEVFVEGYLSGRLLASRETGIDVTLFPEHPPFTLEEALDDAFLPREPDLLDPS